MSLKWPISPAWPYLPVSYVSQLTLLSSSFSLSLQDWKLREGRDICLFCKLLGPMAATQKPKPSVARASCMGFYVNLMFTCWHIIKLFFNTLAKSIRATDL